MSAAVPRYMVERDFGDIGDDELLQLAIDSKRLMADGFPLVVWERSHVCADSSGRMLTYCVYSAPTEAMVRDHAGALGRHEVRSIYEIVGDVTPDSLPA